MKSIPDVFREALVVLSALALLGSPASSQVMRVLPWDIAGGIKEGSLHIGIVPAFSGDTLKPFDNNQLTAIEMNGSDTLLVTIQSDSAMQLEKAKVFLWTAGDWTLEAASSLSDLDAHGPSYAELVHARTNMGFKWDSVSFAGKMVSVVRLRAHNPSSASVMLGELSLQGSVTFTKFIILPSPVRIIPGASLRLQLKLIDDQGNLYSNILTDPVVWSSSDSSVTTVDGTGKLTGVALGNATVTASTAAQTLSGTANVSVLADFTSKKVAPMPIKVALVIEDPVIPSQGYKKLHTIFNWRDPAALASRLIELFREASDSVVNFQFAETVNDGRLFTRLNDTILTANRYYQLLSEPGWTTLKAASDSGKLAFDYRAMVTYYGYDTKRNNGTIDEVWVFAAPYLAMYESQLMGPTAFWWNSPPIKDGTGLTKLLSVMGLNYERGVDQAFHSFGHRFESAMVRAYEDAQNKPWNPADPSPTPWDLFTRIDKDMPGLSHVGNVHYPPNGAHDYDYGNPTIVVSYARNWFRYPSLFNQTDRVNVNTWIYTSEQYPSGDPLAEGQDHLGFLRWWYNHMPRYEGVTDGVLNNWWAYWVDYDAAKALAKSTPVVGVLDDGTGWGGPRAFGLEQNYPNPFNPGTTIRFSLTSPSKVVLKIYDVLGREVATLLSEHFDEGLHAAYWDASRMPSGVYFYRLEAGNNVQSKKMILIR